MLRVAKIASVIIALFSLVVSPLLQYASEGLWQVIRIFTRFYRAISMGQRNSFSYS